ncbi:MAG: hypothetical protein K2M37_05460 [Muribaculaceae bacterium]|nr:hypothetical protein [Muribaculaceae bacterium]
MKQLKTFTGTLKRILVVLMLAVTAGVWNFSFADNGSAGMEPIYQTGRKWIWKVADPVVDCGVHYYVEKVVGDSIMPDGRVVKIIEEGEAPNNVIVYLAYETDEGVFMKYEPNPEFPDYKEENFIKRIAFDVEVGEKYPPGTVSAIENITFLNHTRKVVFFNSDYWGLCVCWIEGIGSPTLDYLVYVPMVLPVGHIPTLYECWQDDELIYSVEAFNVANSIREMKDATQTANGHVYDLFGREISDPQPGTVYIRNGRKFVQP